MKSRTESLQVARHRLFDLLIIGGGITGAAVAQNAASRGLSVALIEKDDFSYGASSRTTQLIHGGFQHLGPFRLGLISRLCKERALLERLGPHLIRSSKFILPLSKRYPLGSLKVHAGLFIYDLMASYFKASHGFERLTAEKVLDAAPMLSGQDLEGGYAFYDCITDDSRLVLSVIDSACREGALAVNYLEAKGFEMDDHKIQGVHCRDRFTGEDLFIRAKAYVNATGAWSDEVSRFADPKWTSRIRTVRKTHIVVPASSLEINACLLLPVGPNRYVYVLPWQRAVLIGPVESFYSSDTDKARADAEEIDEIDALLQTVNSYTGAHKLKREDISGTFSGLCSVINEAFSQEQNRPTYSSVQYQVYDVGSCLVNVVGGELATYRLLAEETVERVLSKLSDVSVRPGQTATLMLGGWKDKEDFVSRSAEISAHARKLQIDPAVIEHLIANYGSDAAAVVGLVELDPALGDRICSNYVPIMAEVLYSVQREMALSLEDVMFRRLRLGVINHRETLVAGQKVARLMQKLLDWDHVRYRAELNALQAQIETGSSEEAVAQ